MSQTESLPSCVSFNNYKARLLYYGGQRQWRVNYCDTYAPIVSWSSIRILENIEKYHNFHIKSVNFIQVYSWMELKSTIFFRSHLDVKLVVGNEELVIQLTRTLYGLKDLGWSLYEHVTDWLNAIWFILNEIDPCILLIKCIAIIVLYIDDCIIISHNTADTNTIYRELDIGYYKLPEKGPL